MNILFYSNKKIFNKDYFNLGKVGREILNNKIYEKTYPKVIEFITPEDFLGIVNFMFNKMKTNANKKFNFK